MSSALRAAALKRSPYGVGKKPPLPRTNKRIAGAMPEPRQSMAGGGLRQAQPGCRRRELAQLEERREQPDFAEFEVVNMHVVHIVHEQD